METFNVTLNQLTLSKLNARSVNDQKAIDALAADMKQYGVMAPLIVRSMGPEAADAKPGVVGFRYEVICGSRRMKAAELADMPHVPVHLMKLTDQEALGRIAHENHDREDFHFMDKAEAWRRWKEAGTAVEQIADEMKVSRSTVHNTIALTNLSPEVKRACWDKTPAGDSKVPESVAKELGTVPQKLQGQALKMVMNPGPDGKPLTAREMIELVRKNFRLDLKKSGFDPADPKLKAEACGGASTCESCIFRTGTSPELFEGQPKNEWLCTNTPGYRARQDAQWALQVEDGEHNRGPRCLPDSKAKDLFSPSGELLDDVGYVKALDPCHQDKAQRAYKTLLGKACDKYLVLARTPARDVAQLVPIAKLNELLDEVGIIKRRLNETGTTATPAAAESEDQRTPEEKKAEKERVERRDKATKLIVADFIGKIVKRGPDKATLREVADALKDMGLERIWERRGVTEAPTKYLDRLQAPDLIGFIIEGVLEHVLYPTTPKYTETCLRLVKLHHVDVKEHEKTITAAERAEPSVKKAEVVAKETPAPTGKKVTPKSKKKGAAK